MYKEELELIEKEFSQKREEAEKKHQQLRKRRKELETQQKAKKKQIEQYKLLGETILNQRKNVENFFLMALNSCQKEINRLPETPADNASRYGSEVDIDDLTPKDKQRIIANLYTKLAFTK